MSVSSFFGRTGDGSPVEALVLDNGILSCRILTFGAVLHSLSVPDRQGGRRDVVLGYPTVAEYEKTGDYLGSVVGRYANRIARGGFSLNGQDYTLACNNGENHLHGGLCGFSHRLWTVKEHSADTLVLCLESADGEEGYPGRLQVRVTYRLSGAALQIDYQAQADADTVCNLTNHSYFNLNGHASGAIRGHRIRLYAEAYTPTDSGSIPLPETAAVTDTPMDLREWTELLPRLEADHPQLRQARGFDHNFILRGSGGTLQPAAEVYAADSGIGLLVETTMPGLQLYTANFLSDCLPGKDGAHYGPYHGLCLETQYFPDSPNRPDFPSPLLPAGTPYAHSTRFTFSVSTD